MKNIAVLVYELTIEYNNTVLNGIVDFFADKDDVNLIISPVNIPKANSAEFDYQYWTSVEVLKSENIDVIVVITNSFLYYIDNDSLAQYLKILCNKPVISVAVPLPIKNSYYTSVSCQKAYSDIVAHLIDVHQCKKIGFFSASKTFSKEATERFEAYKNALKANGLPFNQDFVLDGDFTPGTAEEIFKAKFTKKQDIPFDALLCANDYTAAGVLAAMNKTGLKCPDDLLLFGFDNADVAIACYPTLSTINQSVVETGKTAAKMAYDLVCGKKVPTTRAIPAEPVYRQSCACVEPSLHNTSHFDKDGNFNFSKSNANDSRLENYTRSMANFSSIYNLLNQMDTATDFPTYLKRLSKNLGLANVLELAIVFYLSPIQVEKDDVFDVPSQANLVFYANKLHGEAHTFLDADEFMFNPQQEIIPSGYLDKTALENKQMLPQYKTKHLENYILIPLYSRKLNYGYLLMCFETHNYPLISIYAKILSNSIIQAHLNSKNISQRTELLKQNHDLSLRTKTDELTKVLNRRGFFEYGQKIVQLSISMNKKGAVFFCDLDGLKTINDTYGHDVGDIAIKTEAKVLKAAFRDSDIVARLSGDEFGVIAPGLVAENITNIREKLIELNKKFSQEADLPFTLSISIGGINFSEEKSDLVQLLADADDKLYEEKRIKHAKK